MTFNEASDKLKGLGEEHLLRCFRDLSKDEQERLTAQIEGLDLTGISVHRRLLAEGRSLLAPPEAEGEYEPIPYISAAEAERRHDEFVELGIREAKEGSLAAVVMAGGQGTRLGNDGPKGTFDIGVTRPLYIFQRIFERHMESEAVIGRKLRLFIMTSDMNREATESFIREHDFFGHDPAYVTFFTQDTAPAISDDGHAFLESPGVIAASPNGNGGWFKSMIRSGLTPLMEEEGIKWLNVFAVDNVLQKICDPAFFGAVLQSGLPSGTKVVRKASPDEKVGVICLAGGRPTVVEYTEMSDEMRNAADDKGELLYSCGLVNNYLFRVKELTDAAKGEMPLHFARKAVPYMDESGSRVRPSEPNAWKAEYYIFDILKGLEGCLPYEVIREREFAPVKNRTGVDSVDTARELLKLNGIEI